MPKKKKPSKTKKPRQNADLKSFDLEDIDKICQDIDEEERLKRKRGASQLDEESSSDHMRNTVSLVTTDEMRQSDDETWLYDTVNILIDHLNKYGVCVIDDFLGESRGEDILEEVKTLWSSDVFREGQHSSSSDDTTSDRFRSDRITWTDGVKPHCPSIKSLMRSLDAIITRASGSLSEHQICGRTNAMVACYPGAGAHYVKHVDNPGGDGRIITAIYYLNKNWSPEVDGGTLKIYSSCMPGVVASIDPVFDRVIFFWSDRRNPHEVLPAFRERYAITVWYLAALDDNDDDKVRTDSASSRS